MNTKNWVHLNASKYGNFIKCENNRQPTEFYTVTVAVKLTI